MPEADSVRPAPRPSACGAERALRRGEVRGERQRGDVQRRTLRAPSSGDGGGAGAGGCGAPARASSGRRVARRAAGRWASGDESAAELVAAYRATQRRRGGSVAWVVEAGAAAAAPLRQSVAGALPPSAGASMMLQIFSSAELRCVCCAIRVLLTALARLPTALRSLTDLGHRRGRDSPAPNFFSLPNRFSASAALWLPSSPCRALRCRRACASRAAARPRR